MFQAHTTAHNGVSQRMPLRIPLVLLGVVLALLVLASLFIGAVSLSPRLVLDGLFSGQTSSLEGTLVWQHRLPRALLAILVGLQLATAGLILQAVFRNPLADPSIVGISSGAGLAVITVLLLADLATVDVLIGDATPAMMSWLPAAALLGGLLAASLVLGLSWRTQLRPVHLVLNGIAVGSVLNALVMWVIVTWGGARTEIALIWLAGSLYGRDFQHLYMLWPWSLAGILGTLALLKPLALLRFEDSVVISLGLRPMFWRAAAIAVAVLLAASAVAVTGPVGFVGLVTPHLARLLVGSKPHRLWIGSMLLGSMLMLCADLIGRTLISPLEIPVGALTTLLGIPIFLLLLHRQARIKL